MPLDLKRVEDIFLKAVECCEPAARVAVLDDECGPDVELRRRVEGRASEQPSSLLDQPIVGRRADGIAADNESRADSLDVAGLGSPLDAFEASFETIHRPSGPDLSTRVPDGDPSKIGGYTVIQRLGQGGFGRVYLAHDADLERPVAIKVPNPGRTTRSEDLAAFLTEARILARLDHPNIVPVFDVGRSDDGLCFVVSKLVEGSDLAVRISQGRSSYRESAELLAAVADALHYAHSRGLVHRDIKPANILLDSSGKPCVTDFGLALKDEDFGKGGGLRARPAYEPRTSPGRIPGRSAVRHLQPGHCSLRIADRRKTVPR